jgi:hypothetical protein
VEEYIISSRWISKRVKGIIDRKKIRGGKGRKLVDEN